MLTNNIFLAERMPSKICRVRCLVLLAAGNSMEYRTVVAFAAWQILSHSAVMVVQTVEAHRHGAPRDFKDVIIAGAIGVVLLILVPPRPASVFTTPSE